MKTNFLFVLALFVGLAASGQMSRTYIGFVGNFTYNFDNEFRKGTIKLPKISNKRSGGKSGTLKLEVWLTETKYYGALRWEGYRLFTKSLGTLQGGWAFNDLKYDFEWDMKPPTGTYYVSFILSEYNPTDGKDYVLADYLSFDQTFEVKPKIDYDAFWDDIKRK
ncbi:MAG: hypothetical protein ACO1NX_08680 [Chitinophagaceae bacterium]